MKHGNAEMSRKDTLRQWLNPVKAPSDSPAETDQAPKQPEGAHPGRAGSSAVKVMGLSLNKLSAEAESARALRAQLASGSNVIELETDSIEPSRIWDRISPDEDKALEELIKSVESHGQQVPILVRPHPQTAGVYQIAYGHRRLRAAKALNRKVRAVIQQMTDIELVIAQGKENSERQDLTFIERAIFALNLQEGGFDRSTIIAALAIDKTEAARLLAVARAIPSDVVLAIGPAPRAGRPRWMALAQLLEAKAAKAIVSEVLKDPAFAQLETDTRFTKLFAALCAEGKAKPSSSIWRDPSGRSVVKIERARGRTKLTVDENLAPEFGSFIAEKLDELYRTFSGDQAK
jgi:ParB family chromosome partitioning protein